MAIHTANFLYLGNFASIDQNDPAEWSSENAGDLLGTYAPATHPLSVMAVTGYDADDSGAVESNDAGQIPEDFSYQISDYVIVSGLDSVVYYDATVLRGDGSSFDTQLWVIQLENGDVFVTWAGVQLSNVQIQSITLTSVVNADYDGLFVPSDSITNLQFVCIAKGAAIATPDGVRPIQSLSVGDLVLTRDRGPQPILWIGQRTVEASVGQEPIRFAPGSLGEGVPSRPALLSRQHRVALPDGLALAPARRGQSVTYFNLFLPRHSLISANGLWVESFWPGQEGMQLLTKRERAQIGQVRPMVALFGAAAYGQPARPFLTRREAEGRLHAGKLKRPRHFRQGLKSAS